MIYVEKCLIGLQGLQGGLRGVVVCFWDSDTEVAGSNAGTGFSAGRLTTARSLVDCGSVPLSVIHSPPASPFVGRVTPHTQGRPDSKPGICPRVPKGTGPL